MENFKKFLSKNFTLIVFIFLIIGWFKGCGDSKELGKINDDIKAIKDSTYTKAELNKQLKIMSL